MRISVIIPAYGDSDRLKLCLEGLTRQSLPPDDFEVLVIDDGHPEPPEATCGPFASLLNLHLSQLLPVSTQFRAGQARNRGLRVCLGERVLFLDEDVVLHPDALKQHAEYGAAPVVVSGETKEIDVSRLAAADMGHFSAQLANAPFDSLFDYGDRRLRLSGRPYRWLQLRLMNQKICVETNEYRLFWSRHMSCQTDAVREIGGFCESFVGHGGEDQDLALRLSIYGQKLLVDFRITALHLNHPLRGDPQSNAHWSKLEASYLNPSAVRNGGPIQPPSH